MSKKFLIYETDDNRLIADVLVMDESIWMTQKQMANLFDVGVPTISKHLSNIFDEGELDEKVVISKMETTTKHGAMIDSMQTRLTNFYNLDAIIALGYRINSKRATKFQIWATGVLKEFMMKGFALDDERLKQGKTLFGEDGKEIDRDNRISNQDSKISQKIEVLRGSVINYFHKY